jgi:hypothetical protein
MSRVYKFQSYHVPECVSLDKELARIVGGLPIETVDFDTSGGESLAKRFGVRCLPTLVKTKMVPGEGEVVRASLAGHRHTREVFEKFLEV